MYFVFPIALILPAALTYGIFRFLGVVGDLESRALYMSFFAVVAYFFLPYLALAAFQVVFGPSTGWGLAAIIFGGLAVAAQLIVAYPLAIASILYAERAKKIEKGDDRFNITLLAARTISWLIILAPTLYGLISAMFSPAFHWSNLL
jgi:hypothetical protein